MTLSARCIKCGTPCPGEADPAPRTVEEIYRCAPAAPPPLDRIPPRPLVCIHEAAHATLWLCQGGDLGGAGVDAAENFRTSLFYTSAPDPYAAGIITVMAGAAAEDRARGIGFGTWSYEWGHAVQCARRGEARSCDGCWIARTILNHRRKTGKRTTDHDLMREFSHYRERTLDLLDRSDIWRAVKAVADALMERGRLSDAEVRNLMPTSVFLTGDRRPFWARLGLANNPFAEAA